MCVDVWAVEIHAALEKNSDPTTHTYLPNLSVHFNLSRGRLVLLTEI